MTSTRQPMDEAGRKRHLEALFADEPFLSPTMKARRMHEKMLDSRPRETLPAERPKGPSIPADSQFTVAVMDDSIFFRSERSAASGPGMSFEEAKSRLSGQGVPDPYSFTPSDPISYFRTQVLSQWLQKVDRREVE